MQDILICRVYIWDMEGLKGIIYKPVIHGPDETRLKIILCTKNYPPHPSTLLKTIIKVPRLSMVG
jgi:hypothetical protein